LIVTRFLDLHGDALAARRYGRAAVDHCSNNVRRGRGHAPARLNADCHLNVLVESVEHRHEAIDGEAGRLRLPNA